MITTSPDAHKWVNILRHAIQFSEVVQDYVSPDQYLAVFSTQIRLVNQSKKGDGWAPWQFAVSGNAGLRGEFCDPEVENPSTDCLSRKIKNPEWHQFNVDKG